MLCPRCAKPLPSSPANHLYFSCVCGLQIFADSTANRYYQYCYYTNSYIVMVVDDFSFYKRTNVYPNIELAFSSLLIFKSVEFYLTDDKIKYYLLLK